VIMQIAVSLRVWGSDIRFDTLIGPARTGSGGGTIPDMIRYTLPRHIGRTFTKVDLPMDKPVYA